MRSSRTSFVAVGRALVLLALLLPASASSPAQAGPSVPSWRVFGSPSDALSFPLYDRAHRRLLMLSSGGSVGGITVWAADLDATTGWAPLDATGTALINTLYDPLPLFGAVVDTRRDRLIAWGYDRNSGTQGTFAFSFPTMTWSRIVSGAPSAYGAGVVYDPFGDRVVSFGGISYSGLGTPSASNAVSVLPLSGTPAWSTLSPAGPLPTGRGYVSAVFDARRDRMLVHGGEYVGGSYPYQLIPMDETWELTLGDTPAWRFLPPVAPLPTARFNSFACYDSLADRMRVMGGFLAGYTPLGSDLWSLDTSDPDTARWTHTGTPVAPPRLPTASMFDPVRRVIVAGGGTTQDDPNVPSVVDEGGRFELTVDGTPTWSVRVPDHAAPGYAGTALLDATRDRILLAGPSTQSSTDLAIWASGLTQPLEWYRMTLTTELRVGGSMIVDPVRDRLVLFGGTLSGALQNSVSTIPMSGGAPASLATSGTPPAARTGHGALYDPAGDRMLVFGGEGAGAHRPYFDDVWALSLGATPTWTRLDLSAPRPPGRSNGIALLDPSGDRLVILAGADSLGARTDVWAFSLTPQTWSPLTPSGTPPPIPSGARASFDAARRRLYVVGDLSLPDYTEIVRVLTLDASPAWSTLAVTGFGPTRSQIPSCVFDPARDFLVLTNVVPNASRLWALYMQDWTTPVAVSLVAAGADAAGAHVTWSLAGFTGRVTVERRADAGAWSDLKSAAADGVGRVRYDDATVQPGHAYDYRLRVPDGSGAFESDAIPVLVPLGSAPLAFVVAPNPAGAVPRFVVALLADVPEARVELFDLGGRRVRAQRVVNDGMRATLDLASGGALRPGVYQARLVAGGRVLASARVAVVR